MFFAGFAANSRMTVHAQEEGEQLKTPLTFLEGKGLFWSAEDLKKMVVSGKGPLMAATPIYRVNLWKREYYDPPKMTRISKMESRWDDGEMHEDKTQIYIVISGTGSIVLGGHAEKQHSSSPGQFNGGPIVGGTSYKVKAGDWALIPPRTWHQAQPDPGGLVYALVHIHTQTNIP
jgi:mannose-6-phosphate isomerase-like protein (cupin superfamily)